MKTYNDRCFEANEVMRYTVHCALGQEFDMVVFEYDDHYMVDIEYMIHHRPFRSYVYEEIDELVAELRNDNLVDVPNTKPVLISASDIILDHFIKERRLKRVPRSLYYYL